MTARRSTPMVRLLKAGPTGGTHPSTITWRTYTMVALLDGAEREHASPRSRSIASVESATARSCVSPWWSSPSPTQTRPKLLSHDLDHRPGAAVLSGPAPLLQPAHDHHPAALRQRLRGGVGLVAPHDHGEERRLLLPRPADCDSEHGPRLQCARFFYWRTQGTRKKK